ncbi:MAG: glucosidase, partial [Chloroflexi bacterium]|nr:glucosidase [Chloroflexota bacterium]
RLFGLTGTEGNHGEDVKEAYFYLDNTPTHAYMRAAYRYPQRAFPYADLVAENRRRTRLDPEYELVDTGIFADDRYFDVVVEYAKADPTDLVIRISVTNCGPRTASVRVLPTLWFRNTWAWSLPVVETPSLTQVSDGVVEARHREYGSYWLACEGAPELLFTDNETNAERLWGVPNRTPFVKDGIDSAIVHAQTEAVNPARHGTKMAAHYALSLAPGETRALHLRLAPSRSARPFADAALLIGQRAREADEFYASLPGAERLSDDDRSIQRQAFAGLLWSKQFYHFEVEEWLDGDPVGPPPPQERQHGRDSDWRHLHNMDVVSMPDKWEYPWYAAWDLAFHTLPLAQLDPDFAKRQLVLILREWYMHPNGQLPAYEWAFDDVNPPVHAWAAWRVFDIDRRASGTSDVHFLKRVFHKLLLNFTWWVNRKDAGGRNVFQGGFLGLDNIGVFDRSAPLPGGGYLDQSDGTAWMGMFCLSMLRIALELADTDAAYEDVATKFFEHFLWIAAALNNLGGAGIPLWDDDDEFFYDVLQLPSGEVRKLKVRSLVGLIPLLAVETLEPEVLERLPNFARRMNWFLTHRPDLASLVSRWHVGGVEDRRLFALARGHRMKRLLHRMLDPAEFLSDYGVRGLSRYHLEHPYQLELGDRTYEVRYEPGESTTGLFGGNSNWRGPIWFPINFLLIEALRKFHEYYGDEFRVECPTGSGQMLTLTEVADELARRLKRIFQRGADGRRPVFGEIELFQADPRWRDNVLFYEYFHGDSGRGAGASHQTGWTALIASVLAETGGAT